MQLSVNDPYDIIVFKYLNVFSLIHSIFIVIMLRREDEPQIDRRKCDNS